MDHWCTVKQGIPSPWVHRSSGKLCEASFPTGTMDPWVGISLSPLDTNDGFSLTPISLGSFLWDIGKQNSPRCDAAKRGVPSRAILFA